MSQTQAPEKVSALLPGATRPIVRAYSIVALAALVAISILLVDDGYDFWAMIPLLLGVIGVVWTWTSAPVLVLLAVTIMLLVKGNPSGTAWWVHPEPIALRVLLPLVALVYVVAATRLLSLVRHAVPPDARRARKPSRRRVRGRWLLPREATTRSSSAVPAGEIGLFLSTAPFFLAAAYLFWAVLADTLPPEWYEGPLWSWRLMVLVWGSIIVLAASGAFLAQVGRTQATTEENLLILQDQLWSATRGEQRQINRAVARARLRRQRKEEKA
jgi:hypothetical protein